MPTVLSPTAQKLAALDELELTIDQLVAGGDGLGRYEGIPIFVPRSAPGDRLRVRLTERRPDYGRAEIVDVLEAGPGRREPPCPFFAQCGGCDLQHLDDTLQTQLKVQALADTLRRLGRLDGLPEIQLRTGDAWGYRLRTQLQVEATDERARIGYFARRSHELVAIDRCPILVPELEAQLTQLPKPLRDLQATGRVPRRLDLCAGNDGRLSSAPVVEGLPQGEVMLTFEDKAGTAATGSTFGPLEYIYDARSFFQAHRGLLATLVGEAVGPWQGGTAIDLYAGVGLFAMPLARRYQKVIAVEAERVSARFARRNARRNDVQSKVEVVGQAVETWIPEIPEGVDRVLVDPPRAGLAGRVRGVLLQRLPPRITYVSCHPATLARDLRHLSKNYSVESITALDMFPQTGHLETVVQLLRNEG